MSSTSEKVLTVLQNNWNDSVGVGKDEIEWTVKRVEIAVWLRTSTKNFLIAVYSPGQTYTRFIAPNVWRTEETLKIDVLIKCNLQNINEMYEKRTAIMNEIMRIIHENQFQVPGVSWTYISQEPFQAETENLLRVTFVCLCVWHHQV